MEKVKFTQLLRRLLMPLLLILTHVVPTSRFKNSHFLLIMALGVDSCLIPFIWFGDDNGGHAADHQDAPYVGAGDGDIKSDAPIEGTQGPKTKMGLGTGKCSRDDIFMQLEGGKSAPAPGIVMVEDCESRQEDEEDDGDDNKLDSAGDQELFQRAEMFIGNFYKQLKMEERAFVREIHDMSF